MAFYKSIGCKPVDITYVNGCAYQYNCDKVKSLPFNKCYVNVNSTSYNVGEPLKDEDANPCDIDCKCQSTADDGVLVYKFYVTHFKVIFVSYFKVRS